MLGVVVFALGIYLHFSAPLRSLPWILIVLIVAFGAQSAGDVAFGGRLSGFFGALIMTQIVLWVEKLPNGPPKLVTFLPAFWLLVPGATGLIGVTQIVGAGRDVAVSSRRALWSSWASCPGRSASTPLLSAARLRPPEPHRRRANSVLPAGVVRPALKPAPAALRQAVR